MADIITNISNNGVTNECPPGFIKDLKTGNCISGIATTIPNPNGGYDCAPGYTKYKDAAGYVSCIRTNEPVGKKTDTSYMGLTKVADDIQYNASAYKVATSFILAGLGGAGINSSEVASALSNLTNGIGNPADLANNLKASLKLPNLPEKPKIPNLKTLRLRKKPDIKPKDLATPQKFAKAKELGLGKFAQLKDNATNIQNSVQGAAAKAKEALEKAKSLAEKAKSLAENAKNTASKITDKMGG
jgi:hypothetical protein